MCKIPPSANRLIGLQERNGSSLQQQCNQTTILGKLTLNILLHYRRKTDRVGLDTVRELTSPNIQQLRQVRTLITFLNFLQVSEQRLWV